MTTDEILEVLREVVDTTGWGNTFQIGAAVLAGVRAHGRSGTLPARYICDLPAGVDPAPVGRRLAESIGIPATNISQWESADTPRALVIRQHNGQIGPVRLQSVVASTKKVASLATLVSEFGDRTGNGRLGLRGIGW